MLLFSSFFFTSYSIMLYQLVSTFHYNTIITAFWICTGKYCSSSKHGSIFEIGAMIEDIIAIAGRKNSYYCIYCQGTDDKNKWCHFAMASLYKDTAWHCSACVNFKKQWCMLPCLLLLLVYVCKNSYLFLNDGLYRKI